MTIELEFAQALVNFINDKKKLDIPKICFKPDFYAELIAYAKVAPQDLNKVLNRVYFKENPSNVKFDNASVAEKWVKDITEYFSFDSEQDFNLRNNLFIAMVKLANQSLRAPEDENIRQPSISNLQEIQKQNLTETGKILNLNNSLVKILDEANKTYKTLSSRKSKLKHTTPQLDLFNRKVGSFLNSIQEVAQQASTSQNKVYIATMLSIYISSIDLCCRQFDFLVRNMETEADSTNDKVSLGVIGSYDEIQTQIKNFVNEFSDFESSSSMQSKLKTSSDDEIDEESDDESTQRIDINKEKATPIVAKTNVEKVLKSFVSLAKTKEEKKGPRID